MPNDLCSWVFVYGTLKEGFGNHHVMRNAGGIKYGNGYTSDQATMWSMGGFPGIAFDDGEGDEYPTAHIHGEVYSVENMRPLDTLEGYPHFYDRKVVGIETSFGTIYAWIYYLKKEDIDVNNLILSGEWE